MAAAQTATAPAPAGIVEAARRTKIIDLTQVGHHRVPTWPYFPSSIVKNVHSHRRMMARNLVHVDNIGGDIAQVAGRRIEVQAFPWRFQGGEACITRLLAYVDE